MFKWLAIFIGIVVLIAGGYFAYNSFVPQSKPLSEILNTGILQGAKTPVDPTQIKTLATGLDTPWDLVFLPSEEILFTERGGSVKLIDKTGTLKTITTIAEAKESGEGGLLGITLHPDFEKNNYLYLYFTAGNKNQILRYKFQNNALTKDKVIIDTIPGKLFHNGGRIEFGPDKKLYATTGDAEVENLSQDTNSLAGKILRLNDDGSIPEDNPISGSPIYSYGHRNPQGLAWDKDGRLWATEHGSQAFDEVNLIYPGKNYGWPTVRGNDSKSGLEVPYLHSNRSTWAPSGAAILGSDLYYTGLRGGAIYKLNIGSQTNTVAPQERKAQEFLKGEFGRMRAIKLGPDKFFYILTNNKDGRGNPTQEDDRLIRISPDLMQ